MKKWYLSKTVWFNVITGIVAIAGELSNTFKISKNPEIWAGIISVGNIVLRLITSTTIAK